jgi:hypothetical protein
MTEVEIKISSVLRLLSSTALYTQWIKNCIYADDIFDVGDHTELDTCVEEDPISYKESAVVEMRFDTDPKIRLIMLRQAVVDTEGVAKFKITMETIKHEWKSSSPARLKVKIIINGEKLSSFCTKIETSYFVQHEANFWEANVSEILTDILAESLPNIQVFCYEKVLQNNLAHFAMVQKNSVVKHQFQKIVKKKKETIDSDRAQEGQQIQIESQEVIQTVHSRGEEASTPLPSNALLDSPAEEMKDADFQSFLEEDHKEQVDLSKGLPEAEFDQEK